MFEDYFSLQLRFAERYAAVANVRFDVAIAHCTNLRRRLNLWGPAGEARWNEFLDRINRLALSHAEALGMCMALHDRRPRLETGLAFGCFSYEPPDAQGVLRLHFMPPHDVHASPLASSNIGARLDELRAMFLHIRRTERNAASVRGVSWLYNIDAYRRLFPAPYAASAQPASFPLNLNGSSTWGQVLNWRQEVRPDMRDALRARMTAMSIEAPWEIFPYQARVAAGGIDTFYALFT